MCKLIGAGAGRADRYMGQSGPGVRGPGPSSTAQSLPGDNYSGVPDDFLGVREEDAGNVLICG